MRSGTIQRKDTNLSTLQSEVEEQDEFPEEQGKKVKKKKVKKKFDGHKFENIDSKSYDSILKQRPDICVDK